jgi:uncharacterized membrane protein YgdD (TMEM256/DUF423 family)
MQRLLYVCAGVAGFFGVAFGAFGAHALRAKVTPDLLAVFETAVRYQMYHAFALCACAWGWTRWQSKLFVTAGWSFVAGIVFFSGSLYALVFTGERWLGAVTPFGGLALLVGWVCLVVGALRANR